MADFKHFNFSEPRTDLTLVELRELWRLHSECGQEFEYLAKHFHISIRYAIECIEAAKHLYGGGLAELRNSIRNTRRMQLENHIIEREELFDDDRFKIKRAPAIYSNQRPYDFDNQ